MDPEFPMHLWDKTIPQAELTINLHRQSCINPYLLAWEQMHGKYDFKRTPIAPPGIQVKAHARPMQRQMWAPHTFDVWYIGPALEHYQCFTVWATKTWQVQVVNQVMWFPTNNFPKLNSIDLLRAAIEDAVEVLQQPLTETFASTIPDSNQAQLINFFDTTSQQPIQTDKTNKQPRAPSLGVGQDTGANGGPHRSSRLQHGTSATAINPDTGKAAEYKELRTSTVGQQWELAMSKELGRLFQGFTCATDNTHSIQGTNKHMHLHLTTRHSTQQKGHLCLHRDYREQKANPYRVRCMVGGDRIDF